MHGSHRALRWVLLVATACLPLSGIRGAEGEGVKTEATSAKVIAGVRPLRWGIGQQCTFIGAMQAALQSMGDDVSYNELMGLSGAAFRLCFAQPRWDYSSVDGMLSYDHGAVAMAALGYSKAQISGGGDPGQAQSDEVRAMLCREIDAGRPALGIDLVVAAEWAVIAGYEDDGSTFVCRSYFDERAGTGADGYVRSNRWPWIRLAFGPKGELPTSSENLREAIAVAVTFLEGEQYITSGGGGRYARGLAAYGAWADGLEDEARYRSDEQVMHHWNVNCFCFDALVDARLAAAEFLKRHMGDAPEPAREGIARAADGYGEIARLLQEARVKCVPQAKEGSKPAEWTSEHRAAQAKCLRTCMELERDALMDLSDALRLMQ